MKNLKNLGQVRLNGTITIVRTIQESTVVLFKVPNLVGNLGKNQLAHVE